MYEIIERHRFDHGYGATWDSHNWGFEYACVTDAYRDICQQIGREPGYMQVETDYYMVSLAEDHLYQIVRA